MKVAVVRGKFLNRYEMQFYEPLAKEFEITAFGSLNPFHESFVFPVVKLPSPMDIPEFPYKMPVLNRLFIDAQYLYGLENKLQGFDIVHSAETYYRYTQQALNAKKKGYVKKVIATVLENIPFNNEGIWGRKAYKARARKELDHIIALTNRTKDALLQEGADPAKITVISHFIDTKRFNTVAQITHKKSVTVLFVGRLETYKGVIETVIAAGKLLHDSELSDKTIDFVFAGDGSLGTKLIQLEKQMGISERVRHIHVSYDEMPAIYRNADIFVAPSKKSETWEEQYNTSLLEAQASGLAIVTTQSGGIPENIGDAGFLVPPGNSDALADALKRFIVSKELRTSYGAKARKRAETVHDIRIGAKKLADLYRSLL
jgi:glycosyltransferase involved in cell wall biosynthesis